MVGICERVYVLDKMYVHIKQFIWGSPLGQDSGSGLDQMVYVYMNHFICEEIQDEIVYADIHFSYTIDQLIYPHHIHPMSPMTEVYLDKNWENMVSHIICGFLLVNLDFWGPDGNSKKD